MSEHFVDCHGRLGVDVYQDGTTWLAGCPTIDVITQGATKEGALRMLQEAVDLWFSSVNERGVLDEALYEAFFNRVYGESPSA